MYLCFSVSNLLPIFPLKSPLASQSKNILYWHWKSQHIPRDYGERSSKPLGHNDNGDLKQTFTDKLVYFSFFWKILTFKICFDTSTNTKHSKSPNFFFSLKSMVNKFLVYVSGTERIKCVCVEDLLSDPLFLHVNVKKYHLTNWKNNFLSFCIFYQ